MFEQILHQLHNMPFFSLVPNDDNRAMDGLQLRALYEEAESCEIEFDNGHPCTLFEMLIALAERMSYIIYNPKFEEDEYDTASCFWLLIRNLDLKVESGRNTLKLTDLLERKYSPNGSGGLFPLKNPVVDQRGVEIWYQMMAYIEQEEF